MSIGKPLEMAFFPPMYPDEDWRSIIYRYRAWKTPNQSAGTNINVQWLMRELFDLNSSRIPIFPHNLEYLCSRLPSNVITVDQVILKHTYFPLQYPFSLEDRSAHLLEKMKNYRTDNTRAQIDYKHSAFVSPEIRFCPKCMEEDLKNHGECYIHRSHQLSFIDICYKHKGLLFSKCPVCSEQVATNRGKFDMHNGCCRNHHDLRSVFYFIDNDDAVAALKWNIAKDIEFILNMDRMISPDELCSYYWNYFMNAGYIMRNGHLRGKKFFENFVSTYSAEVLNLFGISSYYLRKGFQGFIDVKSEITNPLLNILVMRMFTGTVKDFLKTKLHNPVQENPFGNGPWECQNKVCACYKKPVILTCTRENYYFKNGKDNNAKNRIRGIFQCPECRFTYKRFYRDGKETQDIRVVDYGPLWEKVLLETLEKTNSLDLTADLLGISKSVLRRQLIHLSEDDPFNISSVLDKKYSMEWIRKLLEIYENTQSLTAVNRYLGVDVTTVRKVHTEITQLMSLGIDSEQAISEMSSTLSEESRHDCSKQRVLTALKQNNFKNRQELKQAVYKDYKWLLRHDPEWLESILPPKDVGGAEELDWPIVDKEIAEMVEFTYKKIIELNPNKQITYTMICKSLPKTLRGRIYQRPDRLPLTIEHLKQCSESKEIFQMRIIPYAIDRLQTQKRPVTMKNILSLYQYKKCSEQVKNEVEKALLKLGYVLEDS